MKIVFTPEWFLGSDVSIEIFSFVILILVSILAFKNYKLSEKKSTLHLGLGFLLIALAELASIAAKFPIYYDFGVVQNIGSAVVNYDIVRTVDIFYYICFFFSRFLTLLGLYVLYKLPLEKISGEFFLYVYFITIISIMSQSFYYIYNFTALIIIIFIINKYYKIYLKEKIRNTKILVLAFAILGVAQIIFLFSKLAVVYVAGQTMQLIAYIALLMLIIRIIQDGKKEKPGGNHSRHA